MISSVIGLAMLGNGYSDVERENRPRRGMEGIQSPIFHLIHPPDSSEDVRPMEFSDVDEIELYQDDTSA